MICPRIIPLLLVGFLATLCGTAQQTPAPRVFDLKASDGTLLKATYFAAAKPGPGVLLLHQCNRQRKVWDDLAGQLASAGISVLTFDFRGFGESGGTPYNKLKPEDAAKVQAEKWPGDVDTAFAYLTAQPGVTPHVIGVGGASCGFDNAIQAARRHPDDVKSLVLLSGPTDLAGRQFLRQRSQIPELFAMADDDEFRDTVQIVPWLFAVSSNSGKRFVHYATGGHGADMFAVHPELRGIIVDWFVTTLIETPGKGPANVNNVLVPQSAQMLNQIELPGGIEEVGRKLDDARQRDPKAELFPEALVNLMGYQHLLAGDVRTAVEIMKLNVRAFPESPNAYDSLSDVYLADGQKDLARQNAKEAIELLASDTTDPEARRDAIRDNAQLKLKQLGEVQP